MAIIEDSFCEIYPGSTGRNRLSGDGYSTKYKVETDDPKDQAQTVDDWFRSTHINYGDDYAFGNDALLTSAKAAGFDYQQSSKSARVWFITVAWETIDDPRMFRLADGVLSRDPLEWRPTVHTRTSQYARPARRMWYEGGYSTRVTTILGGVGAFTVPVNSARQEMIPHPEIDQSMLMIIVRGTLPAFPDGQDSMMYINDSAFTINYMGYVRTVGKWQARMARFNCDPKRYNGVEYLDVQYEVEVKDDPSEDWVHLIPDKGDNLDACAGQDDGRGGTHGQGVGETPVMDGNPTLRRGTDTDRNPLATEFLLDGDGNPAETCTLLSAVNASWRGYNQKDFKTLPLWNLITS